MSFLTVYVLHLNFLPTLPQVNEETSNRRPIMLTYPSTPESKPAAGEEKKDNTSTTTSQPSQDSKMDTDGQSPSTSGEKTPPTVVIVNGLSTSQISNIIR